ncbi:hypothetical protein E4U19_002617 [Claviceps sp. Clav32 group G5]|nr:hypothetical protein E4U19_002617 [Claviceps sp. Clav32 group G5]
MLVSILLLCLVTLATAEAVVEASFDKEVPTRGPSPKTEKKISCRPFTTRTSRSCLLPRPPPESGLPIKPTRPASSTRTAPKPSSKTAFSNILTDHGFPLHPVGLTLTSEDSSPTVQTAHLIDGPGDCGLSISTNREGYMRLGPDTWVACSDNFPHWTDHFVSLRHINEGNDTIIPPDCIRVPLTPECYASLREWTNESGGHKYALDTQCYPTLMPDDKYGNKKLGKATQTPRLPGASVTHRTSHRSLFTPPPIS